MGKDVRELTGADLFEAAFGKQPTELLTIEKWRSALAESKGKPETPNEALHRLGGPLSPEAEEWLFGG